MSVARSPMLVVKLGQVRVNFGVATQRYDFPLKPTKTAPKLLESPKHRSKKTLEACNMANNHGFGKLREKMMKIYDTFHNIHILS